MGVEIIGNDDAAVLICNTTDVPFGRKLTSTFEAEALCKWAGEQGVSLRELNIEQWDELLKAFHKATQCPGCHEMLPGNIIYEDTHGVRYDADCRHMGADAAPFNGNTYDDLLLHVEAPSHLRNFTP